jgi:integral membrane protein (TIGR01906 family)
VVLILLGIRMLLTPLFPVVEYRMPGFPADDYGFNLRDRLKWSEYSVRYLLNDAGIDYLAELHFDDGSSVFNPRELSHMRDVKVVAQAALKVFYISLASLIGLGLYAWLGGWKPSFLQGLSRGGWLTIWLIVAVGLFGAVSFWNFFSLFHGIFFTGDTWLFYYSDTLIRLFPIRFCRTVHLCAGFLTSGGCSWVCSQPRTRRAPLRNPVNSCKV